MTSQPGPDAGPQVQEDRWCLPRPHSNPTDDHAHRRARCTSQGKIASREKTAQTRYITVRMHNPLMTRIRVHPDPHAPPTDLPKGRGARDSRYTCMQTHGIRPTMPPCRLQPHPAGQTTSGWLHCTFVQCRATNQTLSTDETQPQSAWSDRVHSRTMVPQDPTGHTTHGTVFHRGGEW